MSAIDHDVRIVCGRGDLAPRRASRPTSREVGSPRRLQTIQSLPRRALLGLIAVYQRWVSPALPVVTLGTCACRFTPTCSHYAAEAVATHGAARGACLTLRRLVKCGPWHPGGFDPVPSSTVIAPEGTAGPAVRGRATLSTNPRARQCVAIH